MGRNPSLQVYYLLGDVTSHKCYTGVCELYQNYLVLIRKRYSTYIAVYLIWLICLLHLKNIFVLHHIGMWCSSLYIWLELFLISSGCFRYDPKPPTGCHTSSHQYEQYITVYLTLVILDRSRIHIYLVFKSYEKYLVSYHINMTVGTEVAGWEENHLRHYRGISTLSQFIMDIVQCRQHRLNNQLGFAAGQCTVVNMSIYHRHCRQFLSRLCYTAWYLTGHFIYHRLD